MHVHRTLSPLGPEAPCGPGSPLSPFSPCSPGGPIKPIRPGWPWNAHSSLNKQQAKHTQTLV